MTEVWFVRNIKGMTEVWFVKSIKGMTEVWFVKNIKGMTEVWFGKNIKGMTEIWVWFMWLIKRNFKKRDELKHAWFRQNLSETAYKHIEYFMLFVAVNWKELHHKHRDRALAFLSLPLHGARRRKWIQNLKWF